MVYRMFAAIREQVDTSFREDPAAKGVFEILLCHPGFHAVLIHRLAHKLYKSGFTTTARAIRSTPPRGRPRA